MDFVKLAIFSSRGFDINTNLNYCTVVSKINIFKPITATERVKDLD